ncbi:Uu.00g009080.m01.CDS01 [Anthostomella pinea]|uniref:Uu.00g009080.m01.CDS01 n=1 Tax=Anthostomella pinea TaxID=933095 RepID=A0AAI8VXA4_9PEZI|nr:Uu.00g009080.m01.CDS01 [Anthostomella pinea]
MEASPLIKAHDHAKAASTATTTADTTVAINEHTRAAGEFANAAKNTTSVEALRTLKLLEQHHQRLSELLQAPLKPANSQSAENESQVEEKEELDMGASPTVSSAKSDGAHGSSNEKSPPPLPPLMKQPKYPSRDLGASIASNLASARGIRSKYRSQPLSPSVSNTEAPGNMEVTSRRAGSRTKMQSMLETADRPSAVASPENTSGSQESMTPRSPIDGSTASSDEGFSRFYSAFGSIINRISAPLAFAGLPLINEEQPEEPAPTPTPESPVQRRHRLRPSTFSASTEPDLKKIYSKAALRAVARDGQSTNDSFYVVPTSGHTASYASILTFADKEKRRLGASVHGDSGSLLEDADDDDFVDAKESQAPYPPSMKKRPSKSRPDKDVTNMVEELYLENKSLKDMLDKLSKRLHAFESMSQNSGMRLAESMRLMPPGPPSSAGTKAGSAEETLMKNIRELKEHNQVLTRQNEELEKSYTKVRANLVRYREKWDQLKAGAKARRAGGAQGSSEAIDEGSKSPSLI